MNGPVVLVERGHRSVWFAGDMGLIHAAIRTVRCPKQYDSERRALAVPIQRADDVEAALELQFGADLQQVAVIS